MDNLMQVSNSSLGQSGAILVTNTTAIIGVFSSLLVVSDAAFTTLTNDITKNGIVTPSTGADFGTLSTGTIIYGKITAVTLSAGKVILYK